jgi:A/G-specific adenine glycosylase
VVELSPSEITAFQKTILEHFNETGRSFPWRETRDPYAILVSEMMLQQTQTDRVVPKYLAWLEAFPDAKALSEAPLSAVLGLWVGLGYNRRARFLHEACKRVVTDLGGIFPQEPDSLRELPGIGPYTAAAVSTFAFGKPNVFIETNIRSVYIFFFFPNAETVPDSELMPLIAKTMNARDPRSWYYALMDYGAELKKKVNNPNRKSAHYSRQSKFDGSLRQARGAIVRILDASGRKTLEDIAAETEIEYERIKKAAEGLLGEGLIAKEGDTFRIGD